MALVVMVVLSIATTAEAAEDAIRAEIFKDARLIVNNVPIQAREGDPPVLNVEGRTYVPLRKISESLGAVASYDPADRSVYVDNVPLPPAGIPEVKSTASNEELALRIFSQKSVYAEGEPIQVWARLTRENDEPISIYHGGNLIGFNVIDGDGVEDNQIRTMALITETFQPHDEYTTSVHPMQFYSYNAKKRHVEDWTHFVTDGVRPSMLPKGRYTITADADYSIDRKFVSESKRNLKASIEFTVE